MQYKGDQEPEALAEPVEFRNKIDHSIFLAVLVFQTSFYLIALLFALVNTLLGESRFHLEFVGLLILSILLAVGIGLKNYHSFQGLVIRVDAFGITVERDRIVLRRCSWSETKGKSRIFGQRILTDQDGKSFPIESLRAGSQDTILVKQIIDTRLRRLLPPKPVQFLPLTIMCVLATTIGVCSLYFFQRSTQEFIETAARSDSTTSQKFISFVPVLVLCVTSIGIFAPLVSFGVVVDALEKKRAKNPEGIQRHVNSVKGKVEIARLVESCWYKYVAGINWKSESEAISTIAIFSPYALLTPFLTLLIPHTPGHKDRAELFAIDFCIIFFTAITGGLALSTLVALVQRRRSLNKQLRVVGGIFQIASEDGRILFATERKLPRIRRPTNKVFGSYYWKFKASDGKTYRFDPRYLVPVEPNDILTEEATL